MADPSLGWASGFTMASANSPFEPLLAAWNGHRWRTIAVNLGKGITGRLDGLAAASASDAWAVGEAESTTKPVLRPVIEHWDGHRWTLMANPPVPPNTALRSVTVAADGEAWAVGTPLNDTGRGVILHWTKHAWVTSATPETGGSVLMEGVTAVNPGNVWAVGTASAAGTIREMNDPAGLQEKLRAEGARVVVTASGAWPAACSEWRAGNFRMGDQVVQTQNRTGLPSADGTEFTIKPSAIPTTALLWIGIDTFGVTRFGKTKDLPLPRGVLNIGYLTVTPACAQS